MPTMPSNAMRIEQIDSHRTHVLTRFHSIHFSSHQNRQSKQGMEEEDSAAGGSAAQEEEANDGSISSSSSAVGSAAPNDTAIIGAGDDTTVTMALMEQQRRVSALTGAPEAAVIGAGPSLVHVFDRRCVLILYYS